jgi:hypothetical protein
MHSNLSVTARPKPSTCSRKCTLTRPFHIPCARVIFGIARRVIGCNASPSTSLGLPNPTSGCLRQCSLTNPQKVCSLTRADDPSLSLTHISVYRISHLSQVVVVASAPKSCEGTKTCRQSTTLSPAQSATHFLAVEKGFHELQPDRSRRDRATTVSDSVVCCWYATSSEVCGLATVVDK